MEFSQEIIDMAQNSDVFYWDWELNVLGWFQSIHNSVLDTIMPLITKLGNAGIFWILVTLILLIIPKTRKIGGASFFALAFSVLFTNIILKNSFTRCRPCWLVIVQNDLPVWLNKMQLLVSSPDDYSFPSGHSSASFASAVAICVAIPKETKKKWIGALAIVLAALIAISRLYLCVHWPTDVIVGSLVGIACGLLGCLVMYYINKFIQKKKAA